MVVVVVEIALSPTSWCVFDFEDQRQGREGVRFK
jgi:hypothetical protein